MTIKAFCPIIKCQFPIDDCCVTVKWSQQHISLLLFHMILRGYFWIFCPQKNCLQPIQCKRHKYFNLLCTTCTNSRCLKFMVPWYLCFSLWPYSVTKTHNTDWPALFHFHTCFFFVYCLFFEGGMKTQKSGLWRCVTSMNSKLTP